MKALAVELSWCCDQRSVSLSLLASGTPLGPMTRFFFFPFSCQTIAFLFVLRRLLWREDGFVICSTICQWSESQRTHNHTLLSYLRLLGSLSIASYDSQGLWWKYSNPPPHREALAVDYKCHFMWYTQTSSLVVFKLLNMSLKHTIMSSVDKISNWIKLCGLYNSGFHG
jgi:hypothetical protein